MPHPLVPKGCLGHQVWPLDLSPWSVALTFPSWVCSTFVSPLPGLLYHVPNGQPGPASLEYFWVHAGSEWAMVRVRDQVTQQLSLQVWRTEVAAACSRRACLPGLQVADCTLVSALWLDSGQEYTGVFFHSLWLD